MNIFLWFSFVAIRVFVHLIHHLLRLLHLLAFQQRVFTSRILTHKIVKLKRYIFLYLHERMYQRQ